MAGTVVQIVAQSVKQSNGTSLVSLVCLFEAGKRGHFDPARPCLLAAGLGPFTVESCGRFACRRFTVTHGRWSIAG